MRLKDLALGLGIVAVGAPPVYAALAQAAGGSGYSGTLSSNKAIRKQQLISDPFQPDFGSTSVSYEANKVRLTGFEFGPNYVANGRIPGEESGTAGFVQVGQFTDNGVQNILQPIERFLADPAGFETGYVQIIYRAIGQGGQLPSNGAGDDYFVVDEDKGLTGDEGIDTHQLFFEEEVLQLSQALLSGGFSTLADEPIMTYNIFAAKAGQFSGNQADFFQVGTAPPITDISGVTVSGPFIPEPSMVSLGLLATAGLLARRRRRF